MWSGKSCWKELASFPALEHSVQLRRLALGAFSARSPFSQMGAQRELLQKMAYEPVFFMVMISIGIQQRSFLAGDVDQMILRFLPLSLLALFLVLGSSSRSSNAVPIFFVVFFPLLFIAVGLGVGIPMSVLGRSAANARYIVTSAAAIIVMDSRFSGKRTTIFPLKNIAQLALTENRDGTGSITFGSNPFAAYGRNYGNSWYASSTPAFWNIEKPMEVYQLIRKQMTNDQS